jgi:5-methyltetrahydrofolate--homocysteine methyltransferase
MVFLAKEMERQEFIVPLLIGGATTSKAHTAVKIDPQYQHAVVHVNDASRAVTIVGDLLQKESSIAFKSKLKEEYASFRTSFLNRQKDKTYISIDEARTNKFRIDWNASEIVKPRKLGIQVIEDFDLNVLKEYIDWSPFFRSWELHGRYPEILEDKLVGEQASELFSDAQGLLQQIISEKLLTAKAVFGLFEANSVNDDDIEVHHGDQEFVFRTLRQQSKKAAGRPNIALSDFIAAKSSGKQDYMGCFCVSVGFGAKELAEKYELQHDDYNSIMVKALADRFAEAFAEYLHERVRKEDRGYAKNETLTTTELIQEDYKGIRPAPG